VVVHDSLSALSPGASTSDRQGVKTCSVTLPGLPAIVPAARRLVRGLMADTLRADDLELIASEMITWVILFNRVGGEGHEFTLTLHTAPDWARIELSDVGNVASHPRPDHGCPDTDRAHSIAIIDEFGDKWGHYGCATSYTNWWDWIEMSQTFWAEVNWHPSSLGPAPPGNLT
jgi:hypothetical protein